MRGRPDSGCRHPATHAEAAWRSWLGGLAILASDCAWRDSLSLVRAAAATAVQGEPGEPNVTAAGGGVRQARRFVRENGCPYDHFHGRSRNLLVRRAHLAARAHSKRTATQENRTHAAFILGAVSETGHSRGQHLLKLDIQPGRRE